MIKIIVSNMSCGHCQLHVKAELESHDYAVLKIDMNESSVLIDTHSEHVHKIKRILENINYVVDDQTPILDIVEYTVWDDKLEDETNYEMFATYLDDHRVNIVGFNDEEFGVLILCTEKQYKNSIEYINRL